MSVKGEKNPSWVNSPIKDKETLRKELFDNGLSYDAIALKYGVSKRTVARYVEKFGFIINRKERSALRDIAGDKNPNWRGGKEKCPKCGNKKSRNAVTCFSCRDMTGENNGMFGRRQSEKGIEAIKTAQRNRMLGEGNPMNNPKSVSKIRLKAIERIESRVGQMCPNYNPKAIKIIEAYGKEHGLNFLHAENGGEFRIKKLGFWLDGYDPEKNVAIEFYEAHHKTQTEKDATRKQLIINELGCKFIELKEWDLKF